MAEPSLFASQAQGDDEHWISVSDLMAGLMVIFLFIAISYMKDVVLEKQRIEKIAVTWNETQEALYEDLAKEFQADLARWNAVLNKNTLSIRFKEPSVLFDSGQAGLKPQFKEILDDFFPRYLIVLRAYRSSIAEVRIEGHTSSEWEGALSDIDAYFRNMELSQDRTRSVLQYVLQLPGFDEDRVWAQTTLTANGLSSSRPIQTKRGQEDTKQSRRVEFRVRTNAERQIVSILRGES